ncbi:MAG: hypothetical protein OXR66_03980 [Candidatus Woesearchaeota archaeon]|nr:hypothetical protein [Candidatus Woesearchaeota archaeon]
MAVAAVETPRRVLLIDNQPSWLEIGTQVLGGLDGVLVETGRSPDEVFYHAQEGNHPDLILTDLHMYEGEHGDVAIRDAFKHHPQAQVGILSGTISRQFRERFTQLEPGLVFIAKRELMEDPEHVKRKVDYFLEQPVSHMRDEAAIQQLTEEAVGLDGITDLHEQIDSLQGDLHLLRQFLRKNGASERLLSLTSFNSLYGRDERETYSHLHEYKNEFALGEQEARGELRKPMRMMLERIRGMLEHSIDAGKVSISDLFNRELSRMEDLYPNISFTVTGNENPARYFVDPAIGESLRILVSNAADAYNGAEGNVTLEVEPKRGSSRRAAIVLRNGGEQLPEALHGEPYSFDKGKLPPTKAYGTQFGIRRVLELRQGGLEYRVTDGMNETRFTFRDYHIEKIQKPEKPASQLLIVDHGGDYMHLGTADLGCEVHYVNSLNELANLPAHAGDYFGMLLHLTRDWILPSRKIKSANPALQVIMASGSGGPHRKMALAFPEDTYDGGRVMPRLPGEGFLRKEIPEMQERYHAAKAAKRILPK